jgi:hypothetical protein
VKTLRTSELIEVKLNVLNLLDRLFYIFDGVQDGKSSNQLKQIFTDSKELRDSIMEIQAEENNPDVINRIHLVLEKHFDEDELESDDID